MKNKTIKAEKERFYLYLRKGLFYTHKRMNMKKHLLIILVLLLAIKTYSQEIEYFDFVEYANYKNGTFSSEQAKPHRISSKRGGKIDVEYKGKAIPDSLRTAIDAAREVWSDYMGIKDNLKLRIEYTDLANEDIRVSVAYLKRQSDGLSYPLSLYRSITGNNTQVNSDDAILKINSNVEWCSGLGYCNNPKKLLPTMIKCIGRCLGYGSSVKKDKRGNIYMLKNGKSVFDNLIFSEDGTRMSELNNNMTQEMNSFTQQECNYLYVLKKAPAYKIYAPKIFDENLSLKYSTDENSSMYYGEQNVSSLTIDDTTIEILNSLGWNYSKTDQTIEIKCDNIDKTGIASAYSPHTFYIETSAGTISDFKWVVSFPLKDGGYEYIQSTDEKLIVPSLTHEEKYAHTMEGDIKATISFSGILSDKEVSCDYNLTLELKPHILYAAISSCTPSKEDDTYNDYTIDVRYEGSHYVHAYAEEEYSSMTKTDYSDIPFFTRIKFHDIDTYGNATFTIRVENKYGYDEYIIEQPATDAIKQEPTKPILKDVKFVYNNFDFDLLRFDDDARFEVTLYCERADSFIVKSVEDMDTSVGTAYTFIDLYPNFENTGENNYKLSVMFDFDIDIYFYGRNKYGISSNSDSIHANDYIKDPAIIEAINQASAIKDISADNRGQITISNDLVTFSPNIKNVSVADLSGQIIIKANSNEDICLRNFKRGFYIITAVTKDNKRITKKIRI